MKIKIFNRGICVCALLATNSSCAKSSAEMRTKMNSNLEKLSEDWNDIDSIILYGAGTVAKICEGLFKKIDIKIKYVIDQDEKKQGEFWNGAEIVAFEQAKDGLYSTKIVIMTAHTAYNGISRFLKAQGLTEYIDFCGIGQFICEWLWNSKGINSIYHVDMTVTTRCTFRCKNCNMFIPYYEKQQDCTFYELKRNVDLLFERLDYIVYFGLIGGETMLNPVLKDIIEYIAVTYAGKYGRMSYTTNGCVIPSDELLEIMKEQNVHLLISDYTDQIPYGERFAQMKEKVMKYGIAHDIRHSIVWNDFGFPQKPYQYNGEGLALHLNACHPEWNGLNDGRFYYCNISWSAEKSGKFKLKPEDYIELKDINPDDKEDCHKIVELSRGTSSFCRVCGGCGGDNMNFVPAGVQLCGFGSAGFEKGIGI